MTINVAVKCPEGVVMGADSLITLAGDNDSISSMIPYYSKLFQIGHSANPENNYSAGIMLNGDVIVCGKTIEEHVIEFEEKYIKVILLITIV